MSEILSRKEFDMLKDTFREDVEATIEALAEALELCLEMDPTLGHQRFRELGLEEKGWL